jgi:REP element-mobilizing transposase RayT
MPHIRIWIHYVWATKQRQPTLKDPFREQLFEHIRGNARQKNIYIDRINGYHDHVHCLISLSTDQTIEKTVQLLKGEAAYWFNNQSGFRTDRLECQDEYFAVSVNESQVDTLRRYIENQVEHHKTKTFAEEYEEFIRKYKFLQLS